MGDNSVSEIIALLVFPNDHRFAHARFFTDTIWGELLSRFPMTVIVKPNDLKKLPLVEPILLVQCPALLDVEPI